jgi:hypothetical protein
MQIKELYRYFREGGGTNVSPTKPECDYTILFRVIADEDKLITKDGENFCTVIDTDDVNEWYEVEPQEEEIETEVLIETDLVE